MEISPPTTENDSEKQEPSTKKKKKAEALGAFVVESKPDEKKDFWESITKKPNPEESTEDKFELEEDPEIAELEDISSDERLHIEQELVSAAPPLETAGSEYDEADSAIKTFREKIISENKDSDQAYSETISLIDAENIDSDKDITNNINHHPLDGSNDNTNEPLKTKLSSHEVEKSPLNDHEANEHPILSNTENGGNGEPPVPPVNNEYPTPSFPPEQPNTSITSIDQTPATPDKYEPQYDYGNPAAAALLGGIIGYLIGRRRGRIKTEKKLLPVQKKLEKKVINLQWQLSEKEKRIRQIVAEKAPPKSYIESDYVSKKQNDNESNEEVPPQSIAERVAQRRDIAPEARQLHIKTSHEKIGQVVLKAENPQEKIQPVLKNTEKISDEKHLSTMNRAELLRLSEKVIIDGASLRQVYETRLISEKGLRRILAEYLKGGNVKKMLRREITEREIDFERDPAMRDYTPQDNSSSGGGSSSLSTLLEKAQVSMGSDPDDEAVLLARDQYEKENQQRLVKQHHMVDVGIITLITILLTVVTVLVISRS